MSGILRRMWLRRKLRGLVLSSVLVSGPDGMVAVFDEQGQQVPELQGVWQKKYRDVFLFIPFDWQSRPCGAGWEYGPPADADAAARAADAYAEAVDDWQIVVNE